MFLYVYTRDGSEITPLSFVQMELLTRTFQAHCEILKCHCSVLELIHAQKEILIETLSYLTQNTSLAEVSA